MGQEHWTIGTLEKTHFCTVKIKQISHCLVLNYVAVTIFEKAKKKLNVVMGANKN